MPQIILNDVILAFTNCMTKESEYGGYNYSFIIDKSSFCSKVREALATQKTKLWPDAQNTDPFILQKVNAKTKSNITHEPTKEAMKDTDVLIQVKSKNAPIENSLKSPLGRLTVADILIDVFEYSYGKKNFILVRSHADRGCTVRVKDLKKVSGSIEYFKYEGTNEADSSEAAVDFNSLIENNTH